MALTKCKECGNQISTTAKSCPACGALPKRTSLFSVLLVLILAVSVYQVIKTHDTVPAVTISESKMKDQQNEKAREDAAFEFGKMMRKAARDPSSMSFEYINTNIDGTVICSVFRAKNGFGGYNKETALYVNGTQRHSSKDIKTFCPAATYDMKTMAGF